MTSAQRKEFHIDIVVGGTNAVEAIHDDTGLAKARIKSAMNLGAVWVTRGRKTQRLRRATRGLRAGDQLHLYYDENVLSATHEAPTLVEDVGAYSVWDKPRGVLSQGSKWGDHCTVTRFAEKSLEPQRNAFVVHRLDRAATGLLIVAHTKNAASALSLLFRERQIDKRYRVMVHGLLGCVGDTIVMDGAIEGRDSKSLVTVLHHDVAASTSTADVTIETGRKHQIRRHLSEQGHSVVGDRLYGSSDHERDLVLRAYRLQFVCPVSRRLRQFAIDPMKT
jgi:tRNA pseudouridine32 synthase / 23S rRNA pseudouridine746 synthase